MDGRFKRKWNEIERNISVPSKKNSSTAPTIVANRFPYHKNIFFKSVRVSPGYPKSLHRLKKIYLWYSLGKKTLPLICNRRARPSTWCGNTRRNAKKFPLASRPDWPFCGVSSQSMWPWLRLRLSLTCNHILLLCWTKHRDLAWILISICPHLSPHKHLGSSVPSPKTFFLHFFQIAEEHDMVGEGIYIFSPRRKELKKESTFSSHNIRKKRKTTRERNGGKEKILRRKNWRRDEICIKIGKKIYTMEWKKRTYNRNLALTRSSKSFGGKSSSERHSK